MRLVLERTKVRLGPWSLEAHGTFREGVHLVSGAVGSGKSTLARIMAGILAPETGSVSRENISSLMLSFQFPEYHITGMSVREECESWGLDTDVLLPELSLAGKEESDPFSLSRGQLKRFHLGCILARQYDLLILDEPFSSLDAAEKQRICPVISSRNRGITIIFTHEQAILPKVAHIWEIREGMLFYCGAPPEGLHHWYLAPDFIKTLLAAGKIPDNIAPEDLREAACRM